MTPKEWLDSERDYEVGRLLYDQLGDNKRLKLLLAGGPSSYNCAALDWEIQKLFKAGVQSDITLTLVAQPARAVSEAPVVENATETLQSEPVAAPAESPLLVELRAARRPLYDERTGVHGQLEHLDTDEQRLAAARRIMEVSHQLNTNWNTTRYVTEHGQLPPAPPATPGLDTLTPAELVTKRNSLRSRVSKLKKRPDRADDLAAVQATLNQVEALLKPAA